MKKIVFTFIVAILAVSVIVGVAGCAKNSSATVAIDNPFVENYVDMDYSAENGYKPVEGLDAFDVLMAAYDHWINDTHYQRTEAFDFSTTVANQGSMSVYKRNGDEYFKQNVKITTGFQEDNIGDIKTLTICITISMRISRHMHGRTERTIPTTATIPFTKKTASIISP